MRWPRYSEHPWLQKVRVVATVIAIVGTIVAIIVIVASGGTIGPGSTGR